MIFDFPRVSASDFMASRERLIAHGQPAIITGLCSGQRLERITTRDGAAELLSSTEVGVGANYIDKHLDSIARFQSGRRRLTASTAHEKRAMPFDRFLELLDAPAGARAVVAEEPAPAPLLEGIDLRAIGLDRVESGSASSFSPPSSTVGSSFLFAAGAGNSSDLHFDGDGRDVVLFHGFGSKRVIAFPPESSAALHPIDVYSTVPFRSMSETELAAFLQYAGGAQHLLEPGEAVFLPAFTWHYFGYLQPALSINFRFGGVENADAQQLVRAAHRDRYIQNILAGTRRPGVAVACAQAAHTLREALERDFGSARAKYRHMRELGRKLHAEIFPTQSFAPSLVEAEDFLDGALCAYYRMDTTRTGLRKRLWTSIDQFRHELRRAARRVAHWA